MKHFYRITLYFLSFLLLISCSRKKDIITSRVYHGMVSKYNILFNGEQALLKAQQSLESSHKEDFNQLLPVFIVGDEQAVSSVKPDLEKAITKASKVVTQHSMEIKNDQKNDFIDESYMLIGKARYFDRNYLKALETFNFIIQEYKNIPEIKLEAQYWAARTESALDNYLSAKYRFDLIYRDKELPKNLKDDVFAAYAQLEINQGRKLNAYQLITQAIDRVDNSKQEIRWMYLAAQLQEELGNDFEASNLFLKIIKKKPEYDYLFNAQLSRARAYDVDLQDPQKVYDELLSMLKDEKNYDNRDKIYYAMAEVANKMDDEAQVVNYLNKSIRTSTVNTEQKALSYLWLAELNFQNKIYPSSQAYYDSCFQNLPVDHPDYERIKAMKESLGKLVDNLNAIELQDSLQMLSGMSEKQRMRIVDEIIREKKKAEQEKLLAEQRALMDELAFNNTSSAGPAAIAGTGTANQQFYFYNSTLRTSGVSTFTQKWGNRKLEDNWRRKNKQSFSNDPFAGEDEESNETGQDQDKTNPNGQKLDNPEYDPQTYLANIPETEEALKASHEIIQKALYDNGIIYKEEIKDLLASEQSLKEILKRYPNYDDEVRVWYTLYRVFVMAENKKEAEYYKNLILKKYPSTEYAYLILNEGSNQDSTSLSEIKALYVKAYSNFESKSYATSLRQSTDGFNNHPNSSYGPMFLLLKALNTGYQKDKDTYISALKEVIARYPNTDQSKKASEILAQINPETISQEEEKPEKKKINYRENFSSMHRYVILFENQKASANDINIKLTDFNRIYFPNDVLRVKSMLMGTDKQIVTVSGLPNRAKAKQYIKTLGNENTLESNLMGVEFKQFVISNSNFSTFYTSRDIDGYLEFYGKHYK